jgi:hypothetical protein
MNECRISEHGIELIEYFTVYFNGEYKVKKISKNSKVTYEITKELTNKERSKIIELLNEYIMN